MASKKFKWDWLLTSLWFLLILQSFRWMWFISISVSGRKGCVYTVSLVSECISEPEQNHRRSEEESVMSSGSRWAQQQETDCQSTAVSVLLLRYIQWTFQILWTMSAATTAAHTSKHVTGMQQENILQSFAQKYFSRLWQAASGEHHDGYVGGNHWHHFLSQTSKTLFILWLLSITKLQSQSQSLNSWNILSIEVSLLKFH